MFYVLRFTFYVLCFTFYVYVLRFMFYVLRFTPTFYILRFTFYRLHHTKMSVFSTSQLGLCSFLRICLLVYLSSCHVSLLASLGLGSLCLWSRPASLALACGSRGKGGDCFLACSLSFSILFFFSCWQHRLWRKEGRKEGKKEGRKEETGMASINSGTFQLPCLILCIISMAARCFFRSLSRR
jgi:hypothetical protein